MGRNLPVPRGSSNGSYAQPAAAGKPAGEGKPAAAGKSRLERAGTRFEKGDADWPRDPGNCGSREGIPYPVERGAKEKASAKGGECPSQADVVWVFLFLVLVVIYGGDIIWRGGLTLISEIMDSAAELINGLTS